MTEESPNFADYANVQSGDPSHNGARIKQIPA